MTESQQPPEILDETTLRFIGPTIQEMAGCVVEIIFLNEILRRIAELNPDKDTAQSEIPVFKASLAQMVPLAKAGHRISVILGAFWYVHMWHHRPDERPQALAEYKQRFVEVVNDAEKGHRWLRLKPGDFLLELIGEYCAIRLEIERLAIQMWDCAEEREGVVYTIEADSTRLVSDAVENILNHMAKLRGFHDAYAVHIAALRNPS